MDLFLNSQLAAAIDGLGITLLGNAASRWAAAMCVSAVLFLVLVGLRRLLLCVPPGGGDGNKFAPCAFLCDMARACGLWFFLVISLYAGSKQLSLDKYRELIGDAAKIAVFVQTGVWLSIALYGFIRRWKIKEHQDAQSVEVAIFNNIGRFIIWTLVLILTLDNLGVKVVSLMTGLGIGGIAVALAVQKILGDLFASVSIMVDKPFEIGDMVVVGDFSGTVEKIGMKTTRMRSVCGEQLILSNSDLLESRIRNYKRMSERRVVFTFGVPVGTSMVDLHGIPYLCRETVKKQKNMRFDRAHLHKIGECSMIYECVYWVESPDMKVYMDAQQNVILAIIQAFREKNIPFAAPTQFVRLVDAAKQRTPVIREEPTV